MIRVVLVDDHPVMRELLRGILEGYSDVAVVGEAGSGEEAVSLAGDLQPSVVVIDINLPTMSGIQATQLIRSRCPSTVVIGLTAGDHNHTGRAMVQAGASSVVNKELALEDLYPALLQALKLPDHQT